MTIYERALELVADGAAVGLGSGRAATEFIRLLGQRVQGGLRVRGVATSRASEEAARRAGVPVVTLAEALPLDVTVDGADEWTPALDLIKGYGRALVREKVVAAASRQLVILVGPGKQVQVLGERGKLPVEVVPFALPLCALRLRELGWEPVVWTEQGQPATTDNGNYILDCTLPPGALLPDPAAVEARLRAIPGVVGTGLFLGMADVVLVGDDAFRLLREERRLATGPVS
jgi:ribose 5-phosphate isomerase A